jgi:hypothetical protein
MENWILTVDFEVHADSKIEAMDNLRHILECTDAVFEVHDSVDRELFEELGIIYD